MTYLNMKDLAFDILKNDESFLKRFYKEHSIDERKERSVCDDKFYFLNEEYVDLVVDDNTIYAVYHSYSSYIIQFMSDYDYAVEVVSEDRFKHAILTIAKTNHIESDKLMSSDDIATIITNHASARSFKHVQVKF